MKYIPPHNNSDPEASYWDANPMAGRKGAPVPAEAIEHPMREIVHCIMDAGLVPDDKDLTQLSQAIRRLMPDVSGLVPQTQYATDQQRGIIALATILETQAGQNNTKAVHPAGLAALWAQSHGETGWQRLPSGLIFQWGKVVGKVTAGDTMHTIVFPVAFPGAAYAAHWTVGQSAHTNYNIAPGINNLTQTGVTLMIDKDTTQSFGIDMYWFAYGK